MISIRSRLLLWLLPGFALVSAIASLSIYLSSKHEVNARMDLQLMQFADEIRPSPTGSSLRGSGGRRPGMRGKIMDNEGTSSPEDTSDALSRMKIPDVAGDLYYTIEFGLQNIIRKSDNLGESEIPLSGKITTEASFYNSIMQNGLPVRVMIQERSTIGPMKAPLKMRIAVTRKEADRELATLAFQLIAGGLSCCAALAAVLILALHVAFKPLRALGNKASQMHAETLKERFSTTDVPSEILPIVKRLNNLIARLEQSFERERRFSGDLAHELRTPLAAIRTTSEVAVKWPEQASSEEFEDIAKLSNQLQQTLESLLLLARMESSAADTVMEKAYLTDIVRECVTLHEKAAETRGVLLKPDLESRLKIETDVRLIRIIINNLINNAVEYTPEGCAINISVNRNGALLQCSNPAPDLSSEDVEFLFDRLWRKDSSRKETDHTGMGMAIAKACSIAIGCTLSATLEKGQIVFSLRYEE